MKKTKKKRARVEAEKMVAEDHVVPPKPSKKQKNVSNVSKQSRPTNSKVASEETKENKPQGLSEVSARPTQNVQAKPVRKIIVIMEAACLNPVKTSKGNFELLNCDDHLYLHKKLGKDPVDSRPDILHQCLLTLLDSPLNKAGYLHVYVRTDSNVLFEISPATRIPRTFKRFSGLMGKNTLNSETCFND